MKAIVQSGYGSPDVLSLKEIDQPTINEDEVLVRVVATALKDLAVLTEMIEAGKITPVIDRTYPFAEIPAALGYAAQRHVRGKVAIRVAPDGAAKAGA